MATVDLYDIYPTKVTVYDAAGDPADPTAITCTVTTPDGTTEQLHVQRVTTGVYRTGVQATQPGEWSILWQALGQHESSEPDGFTALATAPVVALPEAKSFLNITSTTSDDELRRFLAVVTEKGEQVTGRVFGRRAITAECDGGWPALVLPKAPVVSITTVRENGAVVSAEGYRVRSLAGGVLERRSGYLRIPWTPGAGNIEVTYVAGYTAQPQPDRQGALVLLKHLWETQRGTVRLNATGDDWNPALTFSLPRRVQELWSEVLPAMGS
jgi:uncharacterized phiE125 gp8 family phage protein